MRQEERSLQQEIMLRLRAWAVIALPVPNGIWLPARTPEEKLLVARLIITMKNTGMMIPGGPDFVLMWCGGAACVELKRPAATDLLGRRHAAGRLSEAQRMFRDRAEHVGVLWATVRSWDEMHDRLIEWKVPVV